MDKIELILEDLRQELSDTVLKSRQLNKILRTTNSKLKEKVSFFERLLGNNNLIIYLVDISSNKLVWVNDSFVQTLGYTAEEINSIFHDFLLENYHAEDLEDIKKSIDKLILKEESYCSAFYRIKNRMGNWLTFYSTRFVYNTDANGNARVIAGFSFNISAPWNAENHIEYLLKENVRLKNGNKLKKLSTRELDVITEIGNGLTIKEIAAKLHLSPHTVDTHRKTISRKLELKNLAQIIKFTIETGLV
ncbi:MAG: LuxR C-terminal-related transcriptional regulator [Bacteroidetes bacterium]|nr:LuxR C-terminal-related transcriptional regulator [Bacteroidota bacterium]